MVIVDENGKIDILAMLPEELEEKILSLGEKKFRAGQIFNWLHVKQVDSFSEMTDISAQLRTVLENTFCIKSLFIVKIYKGKIMNSV